jgi:hypothetical protein
MSAISPSSAPSNDIGRPSTNRNSNQRRTPATHAFLIANACVNNGQCSWYYQSPLFTTVYMKPIYQDCAVFMATPRFCAAEMIANNNDRTFSLLPILADDSNAIPDYCNIEYWESHLYNTKQSGITWEGLYEGITVRYPRAKVKPFTKRALSTCPAPYTIASQDRILSYRRHPSLHQHVPGDLHGYGDFDQSFHDRMWSFRNQSSTKYYRVVGTDIRFALGVIVLSVVIILAYFRRSTTPWWCLYLEQPRMFGSGAANEEPE